MGQTNIQIDYIMMNAIMLWNKQKRAVDQYKRAEYPISPHRSVSVGLGSLYSFKIQMSLFTLAILIFAVVLARADAEYIKSYAGA